MSEADLAVDSGQCMLDLGRTEEARQLIALAWLLARAENTVPIPATVSMNHLEESTAAARVRLDPARITELNTLATRSSAATAERPRGARRVPEHADPHA
ncbi:aldo/keto reductase [Streptomyces noursei]|uniref:aldo/keto reductase n=1 Tax=Streptomyces noursei TaxID=1971 RepID=UPI0035E2D4D6